MTKVLVTGATGFLGNYIVEELLRNNYDVIASSIHESKAKTTSWYNKVTYIPLDLSRLNVATDYYEFFSKPDLMIHLAWEGLPEYKASFHMEENFPRHRDFLENILRNGLNDLTVTGTCFEYGNREGCLAENMAVYPANPYAIAKDKLRQFLEHYKEEHDFKIKWIRLFYMFGKGQNPNSLLSQLDRALTEGKKQFNMSPGDQVRDFLPVRKVAEYIVKIAVQNKVTGIINCCSNEPVSVKQFVEDYLRKINKHITLNTGYYPYPDYEPMNFWGDNSKLKSIIKNE